MFITFEGGDGAGKSSQARRLVDQLREHGYVARLTREPGGTRLAGAFRALVLHPEESVSALVRAHLVGEDTTATVADAEHLLPVTELMLLSAARAQHIPRIREWLSVGEIVVCDRFADATRAYQGGGRGLDMRFIEAIEQQVTGGLKPDITILLDLPVEEGQRRKRQMVQPSLIQPDRFDTPVWNRLDGETLDFHRHVRATYLELAAQEPERWVVLDAMLPPNEIASRVWAVVASRLGIHRD